MNVAGLHQPLTSVAPYNQQTVSETICNHIPRWMSQLINDSEDCYQTKPTTIKTDSANHQSPNQQTLCQNKTVMGMRRWLSHFWLHHLTTGSDFGKSPAYILWYGPASCTLPLNSEQQISPSLSSWSEGIRKVAHRTKMSYCHQGAPIPTQEPSTK